MWAWIRGRDGAHPQTAVATMEAVHRLLPFMVILSGFFPTPMCTILHPDVLTPAVITAQLPPFPSYKRRSNSLTAFAGHLPKSVHWARAITEIVTGASAHVLPLPRTMLPGFRAFCRSIQRLLTSSSLYAMARTIPSSSRSFLASSSRSFP